MNFNPILSIDGRQYHISFREVDTPALLKFFVTVFSPFILSFCFEMKQEPGVWKVLPPTPQWIVDAEACLQGN